MVTVGELLRRLSPAPAAMARDGLGSEPPFEPDAGPQLPIETLLRREGRQTGPIPTQRPPSDPSASTSTSRLTKIAMAAGAVAAAGSVVAGGLLLSQPSNDGEQGVVEAEQGSYPGYPEAAAPDAAAPDAAAPGTTVRGALPPGDTLIGGTPGSTFSAAFPDLAAASAAGTIPATGEGAVAPAGSNGAPPSAVPPATDGGAPPASGQARSAANDAAANDAAATETAATTESAATDGAGGADRRAADDESDRRGGSEPAKDGQRLLGGTVDTIGSAVGGLVGAVGGAL